MKLGDIRNSITTLPGVGPAAVKLFAKLNVFSVADLSQFDYIVSDKLLSPQEQSRMESEYGLRWLHAV